MPFGKHRGTEVADLSPRYIAWCLDNLHFRGHEDLREAMRKEAELRPHDPHGWAMGDDSEPDNWGLSHGDVYEDH